VATECRPYKAKAGTIHQDTLNNTKVFVREIGFSCCFV